jgi:hypothetical protein
MFDRQIQPLPTLSSTNFLCSNQLLNEEMAGRFPGGGRGTVDPRQD